MKLKEFIPTTERSGRPILKFSKNGLFTINAGLIDKMQLTKEHKLKFFHDEDSPKDWYMKIDENGSNLRADKEFKSLYMNNSSLRKRLIETLNIPENVNSFIIGSPTELDGENYYPLLLKKD